MGLSKCKEDRPLDQGIWLTDFPIAKWPDSNSKCEIRFPLETDLNLNILSFMIKSDICVESSDSCLLTLHGFVLASVFCFGCPRLALGRTSPEASRSLSAWVPRSRPPLGRTSLEASRSLFAWVPRSRPPLGALALRPPGRYLRSSRALGRPWVH